MELASVCKRRTSEFAEGMFAVQVLEADNTLRTPSDCYGHPHPRFGSDTCRDMQSVRLETLQPYLH